MHLMVDSCAATGTGSSSSTGLSRILIRVKAQVDGGLAATDFTVKPHTPLRKVVTCWCREHHCSPSKVVFKGLDGNTLDLDSSPQSCGWWPVTGKDLPAATVIAGPRPGAEAQWCAAMLGASDASAEMDSMGLLRVHVVARGGDGMTSTTRFRIAPDTPLARLMTTWCNLGNISISEVRFTLHGKSLQPTDQLIQLDSASIGIGSNKAQGRVPSSHVVEICAEPTCSRSTLDRVQQVMAPAEPSPRIQVRIQTEDTLADKLGMLHGDSGVTVRTTGQAVPSSGESDYARSLSITGPGHHTTCVESWFSDDDGRILIDVVSAHCKDSEPMQFKMRPNTIFERLMQAWCNKFSVELFNAKFTFNRHEIHSSDCPSSYNWLPREEPYVINALIVDASSKSRQHCIIAEGQPSYIGGHQCKDACSSHEARLDVRVIAETEDGEAMMDFKMTLTTPFEKMMLAWCEHQGLPQDAAKFEINGEEVTVDMTPSSCGWSDTSNILIIKALPQNESRTGVEQRKQEPQLDVHVDQARARADPHDGPINVQVVAEGADGQSTVDFKMKVDTPFERMMAAWCRHQELPPGIAKFEFQGKELMPEETPGTCGWSPSQCSLVINAIPRNVAETEASPKASTSSRREEGSPLVQCKEEHASASGKHVTEPQRSMHSDEKIAVQVVAQADDGESTMNFKMKITTPFAKMMAAWCAQHGVPQEDAIFDWQGIELLTTHTPQSLNWSSSHGTFTVQTIPRCEGKNAADNSDNLTHQSLSSLHSQVSNEASALPTQDALGTIPGDANDPQTNCSGKDECDVHPSGVLGSHHPPMCPSEEFVSNPAKKISVQVVATGPHGDKIVDFKMKPETTFHKMMSAWCEHTEVAQSDVVFEWQGREIRATETPHSLNWPSSAGTLIIQAISRSIRENAAEKSPKSEQGAPSALSSPALNQGHSKGAQPLCKMTEASKKLSESTVTHSAKEVPSLEELGSTPAEKISVQVVALGPDGENIVDFRMKPETTFHKMMSSWCHHTKVALNDVLFEWQGRELLPTDTPHSLNWCFSSGTLKIQARPCSESESRNPEKELLSLHPPTRDSSETAYPAGISPHSNLDSKTNPHSAKDCGANVGLATEHASGTLVQKINVQVVATGPDGEKIVDFKMKPETTFHKMMSAWCEHTEVAQGDAAFEWQGRDLQATETPASLGWTSAQGCLIIRAVPRVHKEVSGESGAEKAHPVQLPSEANGIPQHKPLETRDSHQLSSDPCSANATATQSVIGMEQSYVVERVPRESREKSSGRQGALPHNTTSAISIPSNKINVQVVAEGSDGQGIMDFKMKPETALGKMMSAWCLHNEVQQEEALFEWEGKELLATDTPKTLNWSSFASNGNLVVHAIPRFPSEGPCMDRLKKESDTATVGGDAHAPITEASVDTKESSSRLGKEIACSKTSNEEDGTQHMGESSVNSKTAGGEHDGGKVHVKVIAEDCEGDTVMNFTMRMTTQFSKMMAAWCNHYGIPLAEAAFEFDGKRLQPQETPQDCNCSVLGGELVLRAVPLSNEQPALDEPASEERVTKVLDTLPSDRGESVTPKETADDKLNVQVVAEGSNGKSITDFKMNPNTKFSKMMHAWCAMQGLSTSDVLFELDGKELKPNEDPQSRGWFPSHGTLIIMALPSQGQDDAVDQKTDEAAEAEFKKLPQDAKIIGRNDVSNTIQTDATDEKVTVKVVAESTEGEHEVEFKLRAGAPFGKMMQAWCKHNNLRPEAAKFLFNKQDVRPEDTPSSVGWFPDTGVLVIQAMPQQPTVAKPCGLLEDQAQGAVDASSHVDQCQSPDQDHSFCDYHGGGHGHGRGGGCGGRGKRLGSNDELERVDQQNDSRAKSNPVQVSAASSDGLAGKAATAKVQVQVIAVGTNGTNTTNVKMRACTPFEKMMSAWCQQMGLQPDAVSFMSAGRELRSSDRPSSCGCSNQSPLVIQVIPRKKAIAPGEYSCEQTSCSQVQQLHEGSFLKGSNHKDIIEPPSKRLRTDSSGWNCGSPRACLSQERVAAPAPPVQHAEAPSPDEKVTIHVQAEGSDGLNVLTFKINASSCFEKVMNAWSSHHGIEKDAAAFLHGNRVLKPHETPKDVGWRDGDITIQAVPREDPVSSPAAPDHQDNSQGTAYSNPSEAAAPEHGKLDVSHPGGGMPDVALPSCVSTMRQEGSSGTGRSQSEVTTTGVLYGERLKENAGNQSEDVTGTVNLQVVAEGQNGSNILQFKMKLATCLGKMMSRWCGHHGIPLQDAIFLHEDTELRPDETPASKGWVSSGAEEGIIVKAMPRSSIPAHDMSQSEPSNAGKKHRRGAVPSGEETPPKRASTPFKLFAKDRRQALLEGQPELKGKLAEQQRELAAQWKLMTEEQRCPYEKQASQDRERYKVELELYEQKKQQGKQGLPNSFTSELAEDPHSPITAVVLAQGSDGPSEVRFKMRLSTAFAQMMRSWCSHHDIAEGDAIFVFEGKALQPDDTPGNIGFAANSGELSVQALPRDSPEAEHALKARANQPNLTPVTPESAHAVPDRLDAEANQTSVGKDGPARCCRRETEGKAHNKCELPEQRPCGRSDGTLTDVNEQRMSSKTANISPPPKRPPSAFFCYSRVRRGLLLESKPELRGSPGALSKVLSAEWKNLSDKERKTYETEHQTLQEAYETAKRDYFDRHADAAEAGIHTGKQNSSCRKSQQRKSHRAAADTECAGDSDESPECDDGAQQLARRSQRLLDAPRAANFPLPNPAAVTIVHHPPASHPRRKAQATRKTTDLSQEIFAIDQDLKPHLKEPRPKTEHMSFKEYLSYDRQLEEQREVARREHAKRRRINGDESDDDLQLAMALSISESQC